MSLQMAIACLLVGAEMGRACLEILENTLKIIEKSLKIHPKPSKTLRKNKEIIDKKGGKRR